MAKEELPSLIHMRTIHTTQARDISKVNIVVPYFQKYQLYVRILREILTSLNKVQTKNHSLVRGERMVEHHVVLDSLSWCSPRPINENIHHNI